MIYVLTAPGFEEIEALTVVDVLRRAELPVATVAITGGSTRQVTGSHGITVVCDLLPEEIAPAEMRMLVLPGGLPGTLNLAHSPEVRDLIAFAVQNGLPIGAICAAPSVLGHLGVLRGRRATCSPGFEDQMIGCTYTAASVEVDGSFITADGPGSAIDFALALTANLLGQERADLLGAALQCKR